MITFTLPGQKPVPSVFLPTSTSSIDLIRPTTVQSARTVQTTLTHFITLYSGTNAILSSIEEVSTKTLGPNEQLQSTANYLAPQSSRAPVHSDANQLVPSVSTLFRTQTMYTTLYSNGNPTISSKEHITSSVLTVYLPQSQINAKASMMSSIASSIANSKLPMDPVMTMYTTYTFYTTNKPNEIVSSLSTATQYVTVSGSDHIQLNTPSFRDEIRPSSSIMIGEEVMRTSAYQPESGNSINLSSSFRDEIPMLSSSLGELPIDSATLLASTSKLPAVFDTNVGGKSTTVIDGSTVVFFTGMLLANFAKFSFRI